MARMSVDDSVLRDPRITHLSKLVGWSRRETLGCLLEIWAICYDRVDAALGAPLIDLIAQHPGFADLMLETELANRLPSGRLRIAGAKERINYLANLKQFGREGGLKSAERRRKESKPSVKPPVDLPVSLPVNPPPPPPDPDPVPVPSPDHSAPVAAKAAPNFQPAVDAFDAYYQRTHGGAKPMWDATRVATVKTVVRKIGLAEVLRRIGNLESSPPKFPPPPWDLPTFIQHIDKVSASSHETTQTEFRSIPEL